MTRKTNDNIGHFGRSALGRKQEYNEYILDLENLSLPDYEPKSGSLNTKFLSLKPKTDLLTKENLASAYQILAALKLDDHTYTHLSSRPKGEDYYYIYPFGLCFDEVTKDNLIKVNLDGHVIEGNEVQYNKTGYVIHGNIYRARPDITSIFHLHTHAMVAVSAMKEGLMPISQWALHFYDRLSYHKYDSLALEEYRQGHDIVQDLKNNYVMLMRNHGAVMCGRTIQEAMFYTYHLEQACKAQIMMLGANQSLVIPSKETCKKAVQDLLSFEPDLGKRDWDAWLRKLKNKPRKM